MDFDLNEDQSLLRDSVERLAADLYPSLESRQARLKAPLGFPAEGWAAFAELGVAGLPFSEEEGGLGGGPVETMLVMEAVGRNLVVEPLLASLVLGSTALRLGGSAAQKARLVPDLVAGTLRLTLAHTERQSRYDLADVATTARRSGDGFVLSGAKSVVPNADAAGLMVVSARVSGERRDPHGIGLFLVPADAAGVAIEAYPTQDGGRAAEVSFSDVAAPRRRGPRRSRGWPAAPGAGGRARDRGAGRRGGRLHGRAPRAHRGLPQDPQAVRRQRRLIPGAAAPGGGHADPAGAGALDGALRRHDGRCAGCAGRAAAALSAVKVQINKACRYVGQEAVQLHGGIGMTLEYIGAHHFKRLAMIEYQLGDTAHHLRRITQDDNGLLAA